MKTTQRGRGKSRESLEIIDAARDILSEIHPASVRAVCYRLFIDKGLIPSMEKKYTDRVGGQLTYARKNDIIPWEWIVDETREPERVRAWTNLRQYLVAVKNSYRRDRWSTQPEWIEVWAEKGTIRGTLVPVLSEFGVTFRVMHGNASTTVVHDIAQETQQRGRRLRALYLGDWDPSGLHMSLIDLPRRMEEHDADVEITRLALTPAEIQRERLPSFPAKQTDSNFKWFRKESGLKAWELDSLSPVRLRTIVKQAILARLDRDAWDLHDAAEDAELESIDSIVTKMKTLPKVR